MDKRHIVVFDGVCNFCNGAVNFIIKRDPKGVFVFTPMQSDFAQALLQRHHVRNDGVDTFALITGERCLVFSSAALEITKSLTGYWHLFNVFKILPTPFRDMLYKAFARNRYALFGRRETCMLPNEDVRSRFIGIDP